MEAMNSERKLDGITLPNFPLQSKSGEMLDLHSLLTTQLNVIVLTAIHGCNACRDEELRRWSAFDAQQDMVSVNLIIIDEDTSNPGSLFEAVAKANTNSSLPTVIDIQGNIMNDIGLMSNETPMVVVASKNGAVLMNYKGHFELQDRSQQFLRLISSITEEGIK